MVLTCPFLVCLLISSPLIKFALSTDEMFRLDSSSFITCLKYLSISNSVFHHLLFSFVVFRFCLWYIYYSIDRYRWCRFDKITYLSFHWLYSNVTVLANFIPGRCNCWGFYSLFFCF